MASGNNDGKGPRRADDDDRSLLFGLTDRGRDAGEAPGGRPENDEPPTEVAVVLEGIAATLGGVDARLSALEEMLAPERASGSRLSDVATQIVGASAKIARAAEDVAEIKRTTAEAARFTGDTKEAAGVLQSEAGNQIARLKEGRRELDVAVAELASLAKGLKAREDGLGAAIDGLRAVSKQVSGLSDKVAARLETLANNYSTWTEAATGHSQAIAALSKNLRDGGARIRQSVNETAESQLKISAKTLGNVEKFSRENESFLERFEAGGAAVLAAVRREREAMRRWVVPALSAALVVAVPSFAAVGAFAQSQFGVFDAYDDTNGWKQLMWDRHGGRVKACLIESERRRKVLRCELRVDGRGILATPGDALPPLPSGG